MVSLRVASLCPPQSSASSHARLTAQAAAYGGALSASASRVPGATAKPSVSPRAAASAVGGEAGVAHMDRLCVRWPERM